MRNNITQKRIRAINRRYQPAAQKEKHLWPYNSVKATDHAIRYARKFRNCNGEVSSYEYSAMLENSITEYINNDRRR